MHERDLKSSIINFAKSELQIDLIGFTSADPLKKEKQYLDDFIQQNRHGEMHYLENTDLRTHPSQLLPSAQTVISIGINYYRPKPATAPDNGRIARYAYGRDYHKVLKKILLKLAAHLKTIAPESEFRLCVDSAPLMEKSYAVKAGLGFIGKNTTLINREFGSFILIGEILTSLKLQPDVPGEGTCGTCTRCLDACPTKALTAPFTMDATRCISYLTIEYKGEIPVEFQHAMDNLIFGCDICQEVCPYNNLAKPLKLKEFAEVKIAGHELPLTEIINIQTDEEFKNRFAGSPLMRGKLRNLKRNAQIALNNFQQ